MNKKIIFFGTPDFTVKFLNTFKSSGFEIVAIVTGEDKKSGRGQKIVENGPKIWGRENGVPVLQPSKLDENFFTELAKFSAELFIVIAYGKIIPERIINFPKFGTINLHYSLLPKYRGASPVESAILNNEIKTGITIQKMVYELDAGDILFQEEMDIYKDDNTETLRERMNDRACEIFPDFLQNIFKNNISPISQDKTKVSKCGKFDKSYFDITELIKEHNIKKICTMHKAFPRKLYFFHGSENIRVKIIEILEEKIAKVLPENRKEILTTDFEKNFGKIFN